MHPFGDISVSLKVIEVVWQEGGWEEKVIVMRYVYVV
jgi:hypothetical protein